MALIKCSECNQEISSKAKVCPNCGKKRKKGCLKFALIFLAVIFCIGLIATNSKSNNSKNNSTTSTTSTTNTNAKPKSIIKPISDITWLEIDNIYNLNSSFTDLQKDNEWTKFKGERVQWSGYVTDISEGILGGISLYIKMNPETFTSDLIINLKDSEKEKAIKVSKGNNITFTGTLSDWGSIMPITLKDGMIIE